MDKGAVGGGMESLARRALATSAFWLGFVFLTCLVPSPAGSILQLVTILPGTIVVAVYLLSLATLAVRKAWTVRADRRRAVSLAIGVPAIAWLTIPMVLSIMWAGNLAFALGIVVIGRGWLDSAVADAQRTARRDGLREIEWRSGGLLDRVIDRGPPVRVAFVTAPGWIDNWSGIVFDPTGRVELANGWDGTGRWLGPTDVTGLFGGDIVQCRPVIRPYYSCSFT